MTVVYTKPNCPACVTVVYTKPNCPACSMTIKHFEKRKIEYRTAPIDDTVMSAAQARGITAAPIVDPSDREMWGGYRPDKIDALAV